MLVEGTRLIDPFESEIPSVLWGDLREAAVALAVEIPGVGQPILGLLIRAEDALEGNRRYGRFAAGCRPAPGPKASWQRKRSGASVSS